MASTKIPASGIDTPEYEKYVEAQERIKKILEERENRLFDPTLLAMAQGFLAPTKTGSFGESLGNVAGAVAPVQANEDKQAMEMAKIRAEMAAQEYGMAQKNRAQSAFGEITGFRNPALATAGGAPSVQPPQIGQAPQVGQAPQAGQAPIAGQMPEPSAQPNVPSVQVAQAPNAPEKQAQPAPPKSGYRPVTIESALSYAARFPEEKETAKFLMDAAKAESDRYVIAQNGTVFDKQTGDYLNKPVPGQTPSDFLIPEVGGKVSMLPSQYQEYLIERSANRGKQWISDFMSPEGGKGNTQASGPPLTTAQLEARAKQLSQTAELRAKGENERFQNVINAGADASQKIASYNSTLKILDRPGMDKVVGIFERPDFTSAVSKYFESNNTMGLGNIRKIMTDLNVPQDVIENTQLLASQIAQTNFQLRGLAKGQGAISDFESKLFEAMGLGMSDNLPTMRKKLEMMRIRSEFERDTARELRKSKMDADDFRDSKEFTKLYESYLGRLQNVLTPEQVQKARVEASQASGQASPASSQAGMSKAESAYEKERRERGHTR
jgi:hypothetical protein